VGGQLSAGLVPRSNERSYESFCRQIGREGVFFCLVPMRSHSDAFHPIAKGTQYPWPTIRRPEAIVAALVKAWEESGAEMAAP